MRELKLVVNQLRCDGCRLCELVCSLRRCGEFNPHRSAVRVSKIESRGIYVPIISPLGGLLLDPEGKPIICDHCEGNPKCVEICPNNVIKILESREELTNAP